MTGWAVIGFEAVLLLFSHFPNELNIAQVKPNLSDN